MCLLIAEDLALLNNYKSSLANRTLNGTGLTDSDGMSVENYIQILLQVRCLTVNHVTGSSRLSDVVGVV